MQKPRKRAKTSRNPRDTARPGHGVAEAERILGVSRGRLSKWRRKHSDAPAKEPGGGEPLEAWRKFITKRGLLMRESGDSEPDPRLAEAEARKRLAQANYLEHKMQQARGELVDRSTIAQIWTGVMIKFRTRWLTSMNGLAQRAAMMKDAGEIKRLLMTTSRSVFNEAAQAKFLPFDCPHCGREVQLDLEEEG